MDFKPAVETTTLLVTFCLRAITLLAVDRNGHLCSPICPSENKQFTRATSKNKRVTHPKTDSFQPLFEKNTEKNQTLFGFSIPQTLCATHADPTPYARDADLPARCWSDLDHSILSGSAFKVKSLCICSGYGLRQFCTRRRASRSSPSCFRATLRAEPGDGCNGASTWVAWHSSFTSFQWSRCCFRPIAGSRWASARWSRC